VRGSQQSLGRSDDAVGRRASEREQKYLVFTRILVRMSLEERDRHWDGIRALGRHYQGAGERGCGVIKIDCRAPRRGVTDEMLIVRTVIGVFNGLWAVYQR